MGEIDLEGQLAGTAMARERVMRRNAFFLVDMRLLVLVNMKNPFSHHLRR